MSAAEGRLVADLKAELREVKAELQESLDRERETATRADGDESELKKLRRRSVDVNASKALLEVQNAEQRVLIRDLDGRLNGTLEMCLELLDEAEGMLPEALRPPHGSAS